jgi:hypothetical protein
MNKIIKERREKYILQSLANIERTGRSLVGVFPNKDSQDQINDAFTYSVGNCLKGLPELLVIGIFNDEYVINAASKIMVERGHKFGDGEVVDFGGRWPVRVFDAHDDVKDRYTIQVGSILRRSDDSYEVQQIVFCDKAGKFPWEAGCAAPYSRVKVWRRNRSH